MHLQPRLVIDPAETHTEYNSALPHAPVVPHVERARRLRAVRVALARGLDRAARVVAPAEIAPTTRVASHTT